MPSEFNVFSDHVLESAARDAVTLDEPRALLDRFVTLVPESGTPDEATASEYIVERLRALGVSCRNRVRQRGCRGLHHLVRAGTQDYIFIRRP